VTVVPMDHLDTTLNCGARPVRFVLNTARGPGHRVRDLGCTVQIPEAA
jgi:hypothetical protein